MAARRAVWAALLGAATAAAGAACSSPHLVPMSDGGSGGGAVTGTGAGGATSTGTTGGTGSGATGGTGGGTGTPRCNMGAVPVCNPYGVDLDVPGLAGDAYWSFVTGTLKVPFYRPGPIFLDSGGACDHCTEAVQRGLRLVLAVRANGAPGTPTSPPPDLGTIRQQVGELLAGYQAAVAAVVVEQGADTPGVWSGTVDQYLAELAAVCDVAHQNNVRCADGGLASTTMVFLLASYLAPSSTTSAIQVITSAGDNPEVKAAFATWPPATAADVASGLATQQARLDAANELLDGVRAAGVDYANFHWYERNQDALDQAIALVRTRTGCNAVVTTDIGQRTGDALQTTKIAQDPEQLGVSLVVWTSRADSGLALLADASGQPTASGAAYAALTTNAFCGD